MWMLSFKLAPLGNVNEKMVKGRDFFRGRQGWQQPQQQERYEMGFLRYFLYFHFTCSIDHLFSCKITFQDIDLNEICFYMTRGWQIS